MKRSIATRVITMAAFLITGFATGVANPQEALAQGCTTSAITVASAESTTKKLRVELRQSNPCNTRWARSCVTDSSTIPQNGLGRQVGARYRFSPYSSSDTRERLGFVTQDCFWQSIFTETGPKVQGFACGDVDNQGLWTTCTNVTT